jgi:hypothetical protein
MGGDAQECGFAPLPSCATMCEFLRNREQQGCMLISISETLS